MVLWTQQDEFRFQLYEFPNPFEKREEAWRWDERKGELKQIFNPQNIIKGKFHSSIFTSKQNEKKKHKTEINKLINKRLKAFQLRQWTKCFCSQTSVSSEFWTFFHVVVFFFCNSCAKHSSFFLHITKACFSLFSLVAKEMNFFFAKWKIQLKFAPTIAARSIFLKMKSFFFSNQSNVNFSRCFKGCESQFNLG